MNATRLTSWILPVIITLLALADGTLHVSLDIVLFRGNFFGRLGPPPGATPPPNPASGPPVPLPLPLNQLFVLNLVGYIVMVAGLWFVLRRLKQWRVRMDVVFLLYVVLVLLGWLDLGAPNPRGLGYLSKAIEVLLLVSLAAHIWLVSRAAAQSSSAVRGDRAVLAR